MERQIINVNPAKKSKGYFITTDPSLIIIIIIIRKKTVLKILYICWHLSAIVGHKKYNKVRRKEEICEKIFSWTCSLLM